MVGAMDITVGISAVGIEPESNVGDDVVGMILFDNGSDPMIDGTAEEIEGGNTEDGPPNNGTGTVVVETDKDGDKEDDKLLVALTVGGFDDVDVDGGKIDDGPPTSGTGADVVPPPIGDASGLSVVDRLTN
jgi:hypothetical protein